MEPSNAEMCIRNIGIVLPAYLLFIACVEDRFSLRRKCTGFAAAVLVGIGTGMIHNYVPVIDTLLIAVLLFVVLRVIFRLSSSQSITVTITSFFYSYSIYVITLTVTGLMLFLNSLFIAYRFDRYLDAWIHILRYVTCFRGGMTARCLMLGFQCVLLRMTLKNNPIRSKLSGVMKIRRNDILIFLWVVFISLGTMVDISVLSRTDTSAVVMTCGFMLILLLFIGYFWFRRELESIYVSRLQDNELGILERSLGDKDRLLEALRAENELISGMIHRDNKLIPSMVMNVGKAAAENGGGEEDTGKFIHDGETAGSLEEIYASRRNVLTEYETITGRLIHTGVTAVDGALLYLRGRAESAGAEFSAAVSADLNQMLNGQVMRSEFIALLAGLCEYSTQSAMQAEKGRVQVNIGMDGSLLFLEVSDNGGAFDLSALRRIGKQQEAVGGESSKNAAQIPIFKILRRNGADFTVKEMPDNEELTKTVRVTFR